MKIRSTASRRREVPVTPLILQGRWKGHRFPGGALFAANCRTLARAYRVATPRKRHVPVLGLFSVVERESEILDTLSQERDKIITLLLRIAAYAPRWVRPVEDWSPSAERGANQLSELIRYLLESFPTPRFFEAAWSRQRTGRVDWEAFDWYAHVAAGGNIRTAPGLPVRLSRRAAHELMTGPSDFPPRQAFLWAAVRAEGVPTRLVRAVLGAMTTDELAGAPVWSSFLQKLASEPSLEPKDIGPLVDYLRHRLRTSGGSFSLKGRTIPSLVEATRRWHAELARERTAMAYLRVTPGDARWNPLANASSFSETRDEATWEIAELLCFDELFAEGRAMHHCVAIYANSCLSGHSSIWSLRVRRAGHELGRVTLRVDVSSRTVVEARRVENHAVLREELRFIEKWARMNRLAVAGSIPVERE